MITYQGDSNATFRDKYTSWSSEIMALPLDSSIGRKGEERKKEKKSERGEEREIIL